MQLRASNSLRAFKDRTHLCFLSSAWTFVTRTQTDQLACYLFDYEDLEKELKGILDSSEPVTIADLAINGNDLLAEGFKGKQVGELLKTCKEFVWQFPEKNSKEALLKFVKLQ